MYWNFYTSLYADLDEFAIQIVESATKARRLGRYDEARRILYGQSFGQLDPLAVVFEKSNLEIRLGFEVESLRILDEAFQKRNEQKCLLTPMEDLTLRFYRCEGDMKVNGTLKDSLKLARDLKIELEAIPATEWTDLEIQCILTYFSIIRTGYLQSNWINETEDLCIQIQGEQFTCKAIQDMLLLQKSPWQSLELIRSELDFLSPDDKMKRYRNFFGQCEEISALSSEPMILLKITANLFAAEDSIRISDVDGAKVYLQMARLTLESTPWIRQLDLAYLNLERLELETRVPLTIKDVPDQFLIAHKCRAQKDRLLETQSLAQILLTLNKVNMLERNEDWDEFWKNMKDATRRLHDNPFISAFAAAYALANHYNSRFTTDYAEAVQCLHETATFEAKFPNFDSPFWGHMVYTSAYKAAFDLGRSHEAQRYEIKMITAMTNNRSYSEELYWKYKSGVNPLTWVTGIFEVIISWLKLDLSSGSISPRLARKILLPASDTGKTSSDVATTMTFLTDVKTEALEKHLFGWPDWLDCKTWERRFSRYRVWLWFHPSPVPAVMRHTVIGDLQQIRSFQVNYHAHNEMKESLILYDRNRVLEQFDDVQLEARQWKIDDLAFNLDLCKCLDPKAGPATDQALLSLEWTLMLSRRSMGHCHKAYKLGLITDDMLRTYQQWFQRAYHRLRVTDVMRRSMTLAIVAGIMRSRYNVFGSLAPDASLEIWQKYDDEYVRERQQKSVLRGADDLIARTALFSSWTDRNHYESAMSVCLEALGIGLNRKSFHTTVQVDPSVEAYEITTVPAIRSPTQLAEELVKWSQKRKARTVTEVLGAEILIPERLLQDALLQPVARALLEEEKELQAQLDNTSSDQFAVQFSLEQLRKRMRNCCELKQIMSLRDGQAITIPDFKDLSIGLGPDVLIVDFIFISTAESGNTREFCAMLNADGDMVDMEMIPATLNLEGLQRWIATFMDEDKPLMKEEASSHLQHLLPFLTATVKHSKPGQTILFSLTGPLNHVPLHAVEVDGQPLIARNKVVYTQSMTLFRYSLRSASSRGGRRDPTGVLVVQALGQVDCDRPEAPSMKFASRMGVEVLAGQRLSKSSFLETATNSSLIHFYGHVNFNEIEPLSSSLEIRDSAADAITVRDIFDVHLPRGSHVTLVGCSSGRAKVGTNDDMLGLSTGLFYAGASSIVSTLWKIQMDDGHAFQEAFYGHLFDQSRASSDRLERFLDFASALQSAINRIRVDEHGNARAPYHWAAFTLQGCWNHFPCPDWTLNDT